MKDRFVDDVKRERYAEAVLGIITRIDKKGPFVQSTRLKHWKQVGDCEINTVAAARSRINSHERRKEGG